MGWYVPAGHAEQVDPIGEKVPAGQFTHGYVITGFKLNVVVPAGQERQLPRLDFSM